jgi:hypothetical protein
MAKAIKNQNLKLTKIKENKMALNNSNTPVPAMEDDQDYAYGEGQLEDQDYLSEGTITEEPQYAVVLANQTNTAVAVVAQPAQTFATEMASVGFDGMELDWHSYTTLSMNDRMFNTPDGVPGFPGETFDCELDGTAVKLQFSGRPAGGGELKDKSTDLVFVYPRRVATGQLEDQSTMMTTNGKLLSDVTEGFKARGLEVNCKEFLEAYVFIDCPGHPLHEELCALSIPPTSKGMIPGILHKMARKNNWVTPQQKAEGSRGLKLRVSVGVKVAKAKTPYSPWKFEVIKM